MRQVLERLQEAGLHLDLEKCEFGAKEVRYLGFIIEAGVGVKVDPEKVRAIREWAAPTTVKGVRSFIGFANFYREFIDHFSGIISPLTALTKKGVAFTWGPAQEAAFERLKRSFATAPILAQWDPDRETVVEADCSGWALGGCLSQRDARGRLRPVAYYSQRLSGAECNYDIHDKELLAVIRCMEAWRGELRSVKGPFTVLSDHHNLKYFMTSQKLNERQARWAGRLSEFNFQLQFRPGRLSPRPDALSRREQDLPQDPDDERLEGRRFQLLQDSWLPEGYRSQEAAGTQVATLHVREHPQEPPKGSEVFIEEPLQRLWDDALANDREYQEIYQALLKGERSMPRGTLAKVSISECTISSQGALEFRGRTWVPNWEPLQTTLIQRTHDSHITGHPGRDGTIAVLSRSYYWPGLGKMVKQFVRNCDVCGRNAIWRARKRGFLKPLPVPDRFDSELSIDFMTDLPVKRGGGSSNMMVIVDRLGKSVTIEPMESMDAEACAQRFLSCHFRFNGWPRAITSDRGSNWVGKFWRRFCELTGIEQRLSTAYHPETDGSTERMNQEIQFYLRCFVTWAQEEWEDLAPVAQLAINNRDSSVIGVSPFFARHGFHAEPIQKVEPSAQPARSPTARAEHFVERIRETTEFVQAAMAASQQRQEDAANKGRQQAERFEPGDKVWLSLKNFPLQQPSKKLSWLHAKYTVVKVIDPFVVELDVPRGIHPRFHVDLLQRVSSDPLPSQEQDDAQPPPIVVLDEMGVEEPEYHVERILRATTKRRGRGSYRALLVKWVGYAKPTWEPLDNFRGVEALDSFERTYGSAETNDGPTPAQRKRGPRAARK